SMAVYLDTEHVGRKIGPRLVAEGERLARTLGYKTMRVTVCTENDRSLKLFDAMGYRHTGLRVADAYKFGRYLDTALFIKQLDKENQ
ncbi:MAG: GNAT family N-acetyltransferase, partial [Clostridia bacterium]|nr:GNAT family N-acetyltransferase [Clostridia bacterium]